MQYLPVVFAIFQVFFLTGLIIYYMVQAVLRIGQQAYITKRFYGHDEALGRQAQRAGEQARELAKQDGGGGGAVQPGQARADRRPTSRRKTARRHRRPTQRSRNGDRPADGSTSDEADDRAEEPADADRKAARRPSAGRRRSRTAKSGGKRRR